ncbi:hypothetical protein HMPREF1992_00649 [Selenomonas sp. oral taxon 892 str. F0426]|nr:hypothetical protein HMPREF1992_00649 [Selenomonas sp. oral taxon 892 str. F0426]
MMAGDGRAMRVRSLQETASVPTIQATMETVYDAAKGMPARVSSDVVRTIVRAPAETSTNA